MGGFCLSQTIGKVTSVQVEVKQRAHAMTGYGMQCHEPLKQILIKVYCQLIGTSPLSENGRFVSDWQPESDFHPRD